MKKLAFLMLALVIATVSVGCASGAPATIDRAAAPQSVVAANTLGFRPEVQAFLGMPIDVTDCVVDTGTNVLHDLVGGARCVLNKLVPIVAAPPPSSQFIETQRTVMVPETYTETKTRMVPKVIIERQAAPCAPAPQSAPCAPQSAPAPRSGCEPPPAPIATCANGACGVHR